MPYYRLILLMSSFFQRYSHHSRNFQGISGESNFLNEIRVIESTFYVKSAKSSQKKPTFCAEIKFEKSMCDNSAKTVNKRSLKQNRLVQMVEEGFLG